MMPPDTPPPPLDAVQRWFQSVVTHPDGVREAVTAPDAGKIFNLGPDDLERIVTRSKRVSAADRLAIYANAYYARLLECLGETFSVFKRLVGDELFREFAFGYLQAHPSRSHTLGRLGERFAEHLDATRPESEAGTGASWPDLLIGLARLEWTIEQVFDGPGIERTPTLTAEALRAVPPDRWPRVHLETAPCLRLLRFQYPVNRLYTTARGADPDEPLPVPDPADEWVAIHRRDFVVRRLDLSRAQHDLLAALQDGRTIEAAIATSAASADMDDAALAEALKDWFRIWTAEGLFVRVRADGAARTPDQSSPGKRRR